MLSPRDFPPLMICRPCKRLFVNYEDPDHEEAESKDLRKKSLENEILNFDYDSDDFIPPNRFESIQSKIWYSEEGYTYRKTREELEAGAKLKCAFCLAIVRHDKKYEAEDQPSSTDNIDNENDEDEEEEGEEDDDDEWDGTRETWWPPLDEVLEFRMKYVQSSNSLHIFGGIEWTGDTISWGLFTTKDDPASDFISHLEAPMEIITELGAPESFEKARQYQDSCLTNHNDCPDDSPVGLPTRLIHVSPLGEPQSARLCATMGQTGKYCSLSYCWGDSQPFSTRKDRYSSYMEELPYENLPKTIVDAFQVTRNLGLQYIWIDSLCIIQDDQVDVQQEMGKMLQIYRNSYLTISAASASNCNVGFLKDRYDYRCRENPDGPFFLPLRVDEDTMGSMLVSENAIYWSQIGNSKQPVNSRGWTLQESLLAPRLLIFTDLHMVWRCQTSYNPEPNAPIPDLGLWEETDSDHHRRMNSDSFQYSPWRHSTRSWGYSFASDGDLDSLYTTDETLPEIPEDGRFEKNMLGGVGNSWRSMLQNYTDRQLTVESDKLPAVSAIAELVAPQFQCDYLAGLWRRFLVYDLMWKPGLMEMLELSNSRSPSWSWAAVRGEIEFEPTHESVYATAKVLDCSVRLVSGSVPFGAVTGGELVIHGYLKALQLNEDEYLLDINGEELEETGFQNDGYDLDFEEVGKPIRVWCLTLGNSPGFDETQWNCQSILLIRNEDRPESYQRIGYVSSTCSLPLWWEQCQRETVTII